MNKKGRRNLALIGFGVFLFMPAVLPLGDAVAAQFDNNIFPSSTLEWSLEADIVIPESEIAERGLLAAQTDAVGILTVKLKANGVETETSVVRTDEKGVIYSLKAYGTGNVETFRNLIYRIAKPQFNIIGGVTQMEIESPVHEAGDMVLVLQANPSTGSSWKVMIDSSMIESAPSRYEKYTLGYGVPQRQVIRLAPGPTEIGPIKLVYKRSWEKASATRHLKLKLSSMPAKLDLSDPDAPTVPSTLPKRVEHDKVFPSVAKDALPGHFDWRNSGIVTPIRDQGASCGSCWAFGTVGIMESALWKNGIANKDLSEQYLISCNKEGWNCDEGGETAHMYHFNTPGKNQLAAGAVLEAVKPYTGTNGRCTVNYDKPYVLSNWKFIAGSDYTIPTVDQIKSAIYTYGPITAGVCAGSGWDTYSGGVFTRDETSECDGGRRHDTLSLDSAATNHQIILVGWDDPGQYWILRNSWGTGWGINGYMHIGWNVSRVGEGTSWVTTAGGITPMTATLTVIKSGADSGTVTSSPPGINCGSTCSKSFDAGSVITLTITAGTDSVFTGWSGGGCSGTSTTCQVTMDSDKTVTATMTTVSPTTTTIAPTSGGGGGGCFIATAAFGSPMEHHVQILRDFRDRYLLDYKLGQKFVNGYYQASPQIAEAISKSATLRLLTRWSLLPIVWLAYLTINFGIMIAFLHIITFVVLLLIPFFGYFLSWNTTPSDRGRRVDRPTDLLSKC